MKTLQRYSTFVSLLTLIAFFSGCAETKDGRKTQAQGTAIGAVGGAILGGLIGYATGGAQGAARGAVAGGLVGGAAGFAYGTHVAHQKAKYANAEQWLDGCIASARAANHRAYAYNATLNQRIASLESRGRAAVASRNKAGVHQVRSEIASLKKEAALQSQQASNEVEAQKGASADASAHTAANYKTYEKEMGELRQTNANLSRNMSRLASLENQINL